MRKILKNKSKSKKWLIVGSIIIGLALLLFIGQYVFTAWLQHKLEKTVYQQSKGIYKLDLYGLQTSPFVGGVSVDSLSLTPDHEKWHKLSEEDKKISRTLLDFKSDAITLRGLSYFKMLFKSKVDLGSLVLQQPILEITAMQQDTTSQHKPLHETVKGMLKEMHLGKMEVYDATFRYSEAIKTKKEVLALNHFNLTVDDLKLDSASFNAENRAYYTKNITLDAKNASFTTPDSYYRVSTDSLHVNTSQRVLKINQLYAEPTISPAALAKAEGRATTYLRIKVLGIAMKGLDYPEHSRSNHLIANHVLIEKPSIRAFKDKKHFEERGTQPLPHDLAQNAEGMFTIHKVDLKNGYCRYEELAEKATARGHIYFTNINAGLSNLSNNPAFMSRKKPAIVQANALLMGKIKMTATLRMPLLAKSGYHTLSGQISAGRPQMLNPILVPTNFIKIDKGYVQSIHFDVTLNRNQARGTMRAIYNNLEVELLNVGSKGKQSFGKKILSKAADWFLIENNNPEDRGEKPRIGQIKVTRKKERSFFTYWKDCLASGLMSSMGLEQMAEKQFN